MKTILIVDRERGTRESIRFILEDFYKVRLAATRKEAMDAVAEGGIDLVFLDILTPGLDGLTILREIKKKSKARVVILTAVKDVKVAMNAMRIGASDYLVKPFDANELRRVVRTIVQPGPDEDDESEQALPPHSRIPSLEAAEFDLKRRLILDALEKCKWNQTAAARRLKISRRKLKYRMDNLGIMPKKGKGRPRRERVGSLV